MNTNTLEQTLTDLQHRVSEIEKSLGSKGPSGWEKIAGAAKADQHFPAAIKLGRAWRHKANKEKW